MWEYLGALVANISDSEQRFYGAFFELSFKPNND